ncbi:MAG: hypothetical protein U0175_33485 [Caldilineaceae bacterium]
MNTQPAWVRVGLKRQPRTLRISTQVIRIVLLFCLLWPLSTQASSSQMALAQTPAGSSDTDMNSNGAAITAAMFSNVSDFSQTAGQFTLLPSSQPPALLARQDYQKVYDQAQALLAVGRDFRQTDLQLPPTCSGANVGDCQKNYADFNNGRIFYRFCADYENIAPSGYCQKFDDLSAAEQRERIPDLSPQLPLNGAKDVRNQLIRAREMFGFLSLAEPPDLTVMVDGQPRTIREIGRAGVLTSTRELANIHMIFGNEFMVDALDYRFSSGDPRADQIIAEELHQLEQALQQFNFAVDVLSYAFNADFGGPGGVRIGDYFGAGEFKLFGTVSERMVVTIGEMADRYRQLGQDEKALDLYSHAFANQYVQAMALATSAAQQNAQFIQNGGFEIINNLERLRGQAQAIHDGINPFGFVDDYVPLQTYEELRRLVQTDFLRDATEDENRAESAQREFDQNRTAMAREMQNLRLTYNNRLLEICGPSQDNYMTCSAEGGLMKQNFHNLQIAADRLSQIQVRMENVYKQVRIEEERAGKVIELTLQNGDKVAATIVAQGTINAHRTTDIDISASTHNIHVGADVQAKAGFNINPLKWSAGVETIASSGYRFDQSWTSSTQTVWDPAQIELAKLGSAQALQEAINQADITNANSAATIKTMLLQTAELAIEKEIQLKEMNRLLSEHNDLVNEYNQFLNLREQARADLADSNFSNPAFRLLRDFTTVEAARSHGLAAQFAYLTAKSLEGEFLVRYPGLNDIFKARTADDIDNFLNNLEAFRVAIGSPGQLNRFPYRISLAKDLLGLSDQNLDPNNSLPASERSRLRLEGFQAILLRSAITDTKTGKIVAIELPFATSLLDNQIFSPNIWNNRIAGVGMPASVPNTQGISINLLTRQFGDINTPEVLLTQGGDASFRTAQNALVEYVPENAKLSGYLVPGGFESKTKTATILASVNGNGRGSPSSALFNRSVAASGWVIRIDLKSPFNSKLDIRQLEDIEINMDTTGIALASNVEAAQVDAANLQSAFAGEGNQ